MLTIVALLVICNQTGRDIIALVSEADNAIGAKLSISICMNKTSSIPAFFCVDLKRVALQKHVSQSRN
ncbi:MAG: hypothetical protein WA323_04230 [Candidatus Nitrosopolaris sp.]